jgi:hypothetical protein
VLDEDLLCHCIHQRHTLGGICGICTIDEYDGEVKKTALDSQCFLTMAGISLPMDSALI